MLFKRNIQRIILFAVAVSACAMPVAAEPEKDAETLTIVDSDGAQCALSEEELRKMTQVTEAQCICVGKSSGYIGIFDYSGVLLSEVLKKAVTTATAKEYLQENSYVVFKGTDGYQVLASWNELMESPDGRRALVALNKDKSPLPPKEGRFRLILPGDKYVGRSVKCLERIEIHKAEGFKDLPKKEENPDSLEKVGEVKKLD
ncbi:MAG TPA: molybdopterin-dependent oxidoreductase [Candidatus Hydrogenedentes bacterium]|nr:molybdopterin-dependent oxidoreductase [Candidatus Hydrogenedentota bacterium]